MIGATELSLFAVTPIFCAVLIGLILLCVKCRERDKKHKDTDLIIVASPSPSSLPPTAVPSPPIAGVIPQPSIITENGNNATEPSLSRQSSMSSRASVRITITNIAGDENYTTNNNLDSPGSAISMADRELPKVPTEEGELYLEDEHDYDILDETRLPFSSPKTPTAEYDTIESLVGGGYATIRDPGTPPQPDYATIPRDGGGGGEEDRMYDCLPDAMITKHKRKPSYEALPDMFSPEMFSPIARTKACTFSGSIRPSSEVYAVPIKPIDKHRAGSERKARENEDTVSVIYASINPDTRSMNEAPVEDEDTAPPMPENPYAVLDNMLSDLNIRPDSRHYDEIANLRPGSGISMDIEGSDPALSSLRRTNPVLANSSPFAVTNNAASVICDVNSDQ